MNIWFQGGGYACIWSFGVAQSFKEAHLTFTRTGGYSGGALVAAYSCNRNENTASALDSCFDGPYGPAKGRFAVIGKHQRNLAYMGEACMGNPLDWDPDLFNDQLWIPIRGLRSLRGTWRSRYRSYDDAIECLVATGCLPIVSSEFSRCYYDNTGDRRGPTIDGGLFSWDPPTQWGDEKTIVVSPWGTGHFNMSPKAKLVDIVTPDYGVLKRYYELGLDQGSKFAKEIR